MAQESKQATTSLTLLDHFAMAALTRGKRRK
jgi:hypothetical protein